MLGQRMYVQAESFKQKVLGTLTRDQMNGTLDSQMERKPQMNGYATDGGISIEERENSIWQPGMTQDQQQMSQGLNGMLVAENCS